MPNQQPLVDEIVWRLNTGATYSLAASEWSEALQQEILDQLIPSQRLLLRLQPSPDKTLLANSTIKCDTFVGCCES